MGQQTHWSSKLGVGSMGQHPITREKNTHAKKTYKLWEVLGESIIDNTLVKTLQNLTAIQHK